MKAIKKLGQHFLKNKSQLRQIAATLELLPDEIIAEIGAGRGELTINLRNQAPNLKIIAIEKDRKLATRLKEKFASDKNIEIIDGDALKILPRLIESKIQSSAPYKLAGNIPYYITGRLLKTLSELKRKPQLIVLTVQKEVAERIAARPPRMNLLAASVQFWAEPKIVGYIPKKDFAPPPKVDSAIIKLVPKIHPPAAGDAEKYYKFVKILFKQPRKTVANNLKPLTAGLKTNKKFEALGINPNDRPQNLDVEEIRRLSTLF